MNKEEKEIEEMIASNQKRYGNAIKRSADILSEIAERLNELKEQIERIEFGNE